MITDIKSPTFPESVSEGTVATWHKQPGEPVSRDELLVDIETDKVVLEVLAPADGVLVEILAAEGTVVASAQPIGRFEVGGQATAQPAAAAAAESQASTQAAADVNDIPMGPAARKLVDELSLNASEIAGSGRGGRVTKEDVLRHNQSAPPAREPALVAPPIMAEAAVSGARLEKRVPMTRMRARIAERLLEAAQTTAMLTTFNEVNMAPLMAIRKKYGEAFEKRHGGTRMGYMGFFVKAAVEALKRFPAVNASIDGNDIVYHGYQDVGVAVSTDKGLVVPVLRNAEQLSIADVESRIRDFGLRGRDGKLGLEDLTGGTFTITNGGVFGSLMSTPILNPPQTAILGMHKIQERPMAVDGQVVILPMMYLALSYDHRLIDGKEAVQFLVTIKDLLEDPARILLDV